MITKSLAKKTTTKKRIGLPEQLQGLTAETIKIPAVKKMTEKEIDMLLSSFPTIYFKEYNHQRINFSDFLRKIFELNNKYSTHNEDGTVQCTAGRRRSIVDIYRLCKHYYKRTTNIALISKMMKKFEDAGEIAGNVCGQQNRRVYMHTKLSQGAGGRTMSHKESQDEFGLTWAEFIDLGQKNK